LSKPLSFKLLFLLTFVRLTTFGQEASKFEARLKFHPLALAAISRPTVLSSIEFKLNKVGFDIAYGQQWGFLLSSNPDTQRVKNFGNQYRFDLKYYFNTNKGNGQELHFISVGYCKIYTQRNLTQHWFSGYVFEPSLAYIDNIHVFYVNYGICNNFGRFMTEGVLGSGVRYRTVEAVYANKIVYEKASRTWPHLSISLRIGYILTKNPGKQVKA
jgi:hypothetical protein